MCPFTTIEPFNGERCSLKCNSFQPKSGHHLPDNMRFNIDPNEQ